MKEYHVTTANVRELQPILDHYSKRGWTLKFAFDIGYSVTELIFEKDVEDEKEDRSVQR